VCLLVYVCTCVCLHACVWDGQGCTKGHMGQCGISGKSVLEDDYQHQIKESLAARSHILSLQIEFKSTSKLSFQHS